MPTPQPLPAATPPRPTQPPRPTWGPRPGTPAARRQPRDLRQRMISKVKTVAIILLAMIILGLLADLSRAAIKMADLRAQVKIAQHATPPAKSCRK